MAITINGTGTITGINAGGLPDGSVTAADIESSLDLTGKTVTLPSGTGGKILQAVSRSTTTPTTCGNQNVWTATDCYHSITTSSASSKVIICVTSVINSYAANTWIDVDIYRDSTRLGTNTNGMTGNYNSSDNHVPLGITFLDSPGAAGTYTYKVYVKNRNSNGVNRFNADGQMTTMVLMEVAG